MSALAVITALVVVTAAVSLLLLRPRPRRGRYRFIVSLRPLAQLLTDDRTHWRIK